MRAAVRVLSATFVTLASAGALAQAPLDACKGADVIPIDIPVYHDRADSPRFTYKFQLKRAANPNVPTVIVLPGGPGGPSIGYTIGAGSIPPIYNIVYTDPRGTNCNAQAEGVLPIDAFRTEYLARDVKAMIEWLGQHAGLSYYFVYGHSYGSVHGTVLVSILEKESNLRPQGLVLEAIFGRYLQRGAQEQIEAVDAQWQRIRGTLLPQVASLFDQAPLPLGYSSSQWASIIFRSLYEGDVPGRGNRLQIQLNALAAGNPDIDAALRDYFDHHLFNPARFLIDPRIIAINCRELFGDHYANDLVGGHLVLTGDNVCARANLSLTEPYDSASWPVTVPIYYFQGQYDQVIPLPYSTYHYFMHPRAYRHYAFIGGASHDPLSQNLTTAGCSAEVWDDILYKRNGERGALAKCQIPISLTETPPAQGAP